MPGQREQQREGVLRDADGVSARRAHDQDTAACGFLEVDIIYADSGAANHTETRRFFQQLRRYFGCAAHDKRIRVGDLRMERVLRGQDDVPAGAAQEFHATFTNFICNDDFHRASCDLLSRCRASGA